LFYWVFGHPKGGGTGRGDREKGGFFFTFNRLLGRGGRRFIPKKKADPAGRFRPLDAVVAVAMVDLLRAAAGPVVRGGAQGPSVSGYLSGSFARQRGAGSPFVAFDRGRGAGGALLAGGGGDAWEAGGALTLGGGGGGDGRYQRWGAFVYCRGIRSARRDVGEPSNRGPSRPFSRTRNWQQHTVRTHNQRKKTPQPGEPPGPRTTARSRRFAGGKGGKYANRGAPPEQTGRGGPPVVRSSAAGGGNTRGLSVSHEGGGNPASSKVPPLPPGTAHRFRERSGNSGAVGPQRKGAQ